MNLIIGDTSQLAKFLPENFLRISSRNIDFSSFKHQNFDTVYITFAEQRTFNQSLIEKDFIDINVDYTSKVITFFSNISRKIIIYGTAELWNNTNGTIDLNTKIDYRYSPYIKSKEILYYKLINNRLNNKWENVIIIHPFNFNSTFRKDGFLFYKVFDSILNNRKITVGYLDIRRDLIHTKYLAQKSLSINQDSIIGSGKITNIREFISEIYLYFNKHIDDFVIENKNVTSNHKNNIFWLNTTEIYNSLFEDTIEDLKNERDKISK